MSPDEWMKTLPADVQAHLRAAPRGPMPTPPQPKEPDNADASRSDR